MLLSNSSSKGNLNVKKKRPTQIPIQALQYNEVVANSTNPNVWELRSKKMASATSSSNSIPAASEDQSSNQPPLKEKASNQQQQIEPELRTILPPGFQGRRESQEGLASVPEEESRSSYDPYGMRHYMSNIGGVKLIDAARKGFSQFCKDFNEDEKEEGSGSFRILPPKEFLFDFTPENVKGDVDERLLVDPRPMVTYIDEGQKEYHLFDEFVNDSLMMKNVYNVNDMDIMNLFEICGRMLLPRSVERWPIEVLGEDLAQLKKKILLIKGPEGQQQKAKSAIRSGIGANRSGNRNQQKQSNQEKSEEESEVGPVGAFGLRSLARLCNFQGIEQSPMGFLTFTGMNLHKLMMNLDKNQTVTQTFAGPLANHNYSLDYNYIEMAKPFEEYNLPFQGWDLEEMINWKKSMRITRQRISSFCFDILVYIFYTFHGDALQVLAANELYERGWRFHKTFQVWLKPWGEHRDDYREKGTARESDNYKYFNYEKWTFLCHKFRINEGALEARPPEFNDPLWN